MTTGAEMSILWDLDNVCPDRLGRNDIGKVTKPLLSVARSLGTEVSAMAFANDRRFTYVSGHERQRRAEAPEQPWGDGISGWDAKAQKLRCGVCGAKFDTMVKLQKHFHQLHAREKRKLVNRKLNPKQRDRLRKYNSAQVDVIPSAENNVRRILIESGFQVRMVSRRRNAADDALLDQGYLFCRSPNASTLVLVSGDSDFIPLLQHARDHHVATMVAFLDASQTSSNLLAHADASFDLVLNHLVSNTPTGRHLVHRIRSGFDDDDDDDPGDPH